MLPLASALYAWLTHLSYQSRREMAYGLAVINMCFLAPFMHISCGHHFPSMFAPIISLMTVLQQVKQTHKGKYQIFHNSLDHHRLVLFGCDTMLHN